MKINLIKNILLCSGLAIAAGSCSDYLTETDPNNVQKSEYYKNLTETNSGLTAVFAQLRDLDMVGVQTESYRSDMAWPGYGRPVPTTSSYNNIYYHLYDNTSNEIKLKWQGLYKGIFRANQVIEGLEKLEASGAIKTESSQQQWNEQMGQAKFFRGLFHYYLAISFQHTDGKCAVIADKAAEKLEDFHKGLSSREEVLDFARTDLHQAYKLLPNVYDANAISKGEGRPTKATAATILGNSFLLTTQKSDANFKQNVDSAAYYYDDVVNNSAYGLKLVTDFSKINTYAGEFNSESILEISYSKNHNTELDRWDEKSMYNKLGAYVESMSVPCWLINAYSTEQMDPLDERNYYDSIPDPEQPEIKFRRMRLVPLRCSSNIAVVNDVHTKFYADETTTKNIICQRDGFGFAYYRQYSEWDITDGERSNWDAGKNVVLDKLSEVMINYAECLVYQDKLSEAIALLNQIRERWGLVLLGQDDGSGLHTFDNKVYTANALLNQIMYVEKPLETSVEGFQTRWTDLRRWGIIEKRFDDLANQVYYVGNFVFNYNGTQFSRSNALVLDHKQPGFDYDNPADANVWRNIINYEYVQPAKNIWIDRDKYHFYYPIPLTEIQNNMNIN